MSWVDCAARGATLGRGVFQRANWRDDGDFSAPKKRLNLTLPFDLPNSVLNRHLIRVFNSVYNWVQTHGAAQSREHCQSFFYPLDAIHDWNRMYGSSGFDQYQCVIPTDTTMLAMERLIEVISQSGQGSFLAVLTTLGAKSSGGILAFPMEGATLALDIGNRGAKALDLMARLDTIVAEAGGRLYPAKDGRMPAWMFQRGYPRWREVSDLKDPMISSSFWERVSSL